MFAQCFICLVALTSFLIFSLKFRVDLEGVRSAREWLEWSLEP